jgi:NAD(P)-dependent dehydrogenase (short-subunit alcohol dehydrogenase family)
MGRLDGRIAVVSGGASGIGRAVALRLALEGAIIEIVDKDDAAGTCDAIIAAGGKAASAICDVTDEGQVNAVARTLEVRHGRVDILVNGAGILTGRGPWHARSRADLQRFIDANYLGAYSLAKTLYSLLTRSLHGRVIMIGSRTVFTANADMAGYVESKAAVTALTRILARDLGQYGVTANAVAPGMIATPGTRAHSVEAMFERATAAQAIKRRLEPEDVAALVAFLASDDAAMITGQTIVCDGGGVMH